jgi:hypothetical protein
MVVKPQKVEIHSQKAILTSNRIKRAQMLKAIQEITSAQNEVAATIEIRHKNNK